MRRTMNPETRQSLESIAANANMAYWEVYAAWLSYLAYAKAQGIRATLRDFAATLGVPV